MAFPILATILRPIWRSRAISLKTKLRIFNNNAKTLLLYACETWRVTKASNNRIQTSVNRCLRHIVQVRWQDKIRNEDLWKRAEQQHLHLQVRKRKWRWLGHTLRKPFANVTGHALRWTPQGKRSRGRPKTTWRRSTEAEVKQTGIMSWNKLEKVAKDRGRWSDKIGGRPMYQWELTGLRIHVCCYWCQCVCECRNLFENKLLRLCCVEVPRTIAFFESEILKSVCFLIHLYRSGMVHQYYLLLLQCVAITTIECFHPSHA